MKRIFLLSIITFISFSSFCQDIIIKVDGNEIKVKVVEITIETIKYRNFDQLDGPLRNISKNDVFMIIYEDGTREVYKETANNSESSTKEPNPISDTTIVVKSKNFTINKDLINYIDKRSNPLIVGETFSRAILVTGTTTKAKDKKGLYFPSFKTVFNERIDNSKLEIANNSNTIEISLNEMYYKLIDKFTYMQAEQLCTITVKIKNSNNQIIYNKKFSATNSSKAEELRNYINMNGYKATVFKIEGATMFLVVIDKIIEEMANDSNLIKLLDND
jgi:ABC-type lipoprotein release transport system permease subunit